jgi:hypothetical protein
VTDNGNNLFRNSSLAYNDDNLSGDTALSGIDCKPVGKASDEDTETVNMPEESADVCRKESHAGPDTDTDDTSVALHDQYENDRNEDDLFLKEYADYPGRTDADDSRRALHCQLAFTDCRDITVTCKEKTRHVEELFIENNTVWIHLQNDPGVTEIDCAYGIGHYIPSWSMEAEDTMRVGRSEGSMSLGRCIAALLRVHIDRDLQDHGMFEKRVSRKDAPVLKHYGIELRLGGRQMKLIKDRRFITLEEAAVFLSRASGNVIVDEL